MSKVHEFISLVHEFFASNPGKSCRLKVEYGGTARCMQFELGCAICKVVHYPEHSSPEKLYTPSILDWFSLPEIPIVVVIYNQH